MSHMLRLVQVRMMTTVQNWQKNRVQNGCTIESTNGGKKSRQKKNKICPQNLRDLEERTNCQDFSSNQLCRTSETVNLTTSNTLEIS